jgi:hypothetical protein
MMSRFKGVRDICRAIKFLERLCGKNVTWGSVEKNHLFYRDIIFRDPFYWSTMHKRHISQNFQVIG